MKIYTIRDRLVDYWGQPFVGPDDRAVQQAIARTVNSEDPTSDIANTPHHFEVWQLGSVTEDGHLVPEKSFICDCSSLIRRSVRERTAGEPGTDQAPKPGGSGEGTPGRTPGDARALNGSVPHQAQGEGQPGEEVRRGPLGGYPPRGNS